MSVSPLHKKKKSLFLKIHIGKTWNLFCFNFLFGVETFLTSLVILSLPCPVSGTKPLFEWHFPSCSQGSTVLFAQWTWRATENPIPRSPCFYKGCARSPPDRKHVHGRAALHRNPGKVLQSETLTTLARKWQFLNTPDWTQYYLIKELQTWEQLNPHLAKHLQAPNRR